MPVIATGLDYSARRIGGASIARAGYKFANRYLWFPGQQYPWLTAIEYHDLTANGVEVHAIYEQNTNDPAGGWTAGVRMAQQAVESARAAGLPAGRTIWMCADAWLDKHGIPVATAMSFLDGARSVLAPAGYLTGAYGFRDFVYAAQDGKRADRFWLCGAESGVRAGIHMYQWNNGHVYVDGVECDLNKQYIPMITQEEDVPLTLDEKKEIAQFVVDTLLTKKIRRSNDPDEPAVDGEFELGWLFAATDGHTGAIKEELREIRAKVEQLEASGVPVAVDYGKVGDAAADEIDERQRERLGAAEA